MSSSNADEEGGGARVWDLASGEELGRLVSASGTETVKCLQVEEAVCVTGSSDAQIRLWDLRQVGVVSSVVHELDEVPNSTTSIQESSWAPSDPPEHSSLTSTFRGHTQAVSSLYFEDSCLVRRLITIFARANELHNRLRSAGLPTKQYASGTSTQGSVC